MRFLAAVAVAGAFLTTTVSAATATSSAAQAEGTGDGVAINQALNIAAEWTAKLNESFIHYDNTLFGAPPILDTTSSLIAELDKGIKIAKSSPFLSVNGATSIYNTVLGLQKDVNATLTSVMSRKADFDHWRLGGIIYLTLKLVKRETDSFSGSILDKVPASLDSISRPAVEVIDGYFDTAIAYFSDE